MTNTQKFYEWYTKKVKGDFINNETLERIQNKLDYKPVKPLKNE